MNSNPCEIRTLPKCTTKVAHFFELAKFLGTKCAKQLPFRYLLGSSVYNTCER